MEVFGHMGPKYVELLAYFAVKAHQVWNWPQWFFWHKFAPKFGACLAEGNHLKAQYMREWYAHQRTDDDDDAVDAAVNDPDLDLDGPATSSRRRGHVRVPMADPFGVRGRRRGASPGYGSRGRRGRGGRRHHGGRGRGRGGAHGPARRGRRRGPAA